MKEEDNKRKVANIQDYQTTDKGRGISLNTLSSYRDHLLNTIESFIYPQEPEDSTLELFVDNPAEKEIKFTRDALDNSISRSAARLTVENVLRRFGFNTEMIRQDYDKNEELTYSSYLNSRLKLNITRIPSNALIDQYISLWTLCVIPPQIKLIK